MKKMNATQLTLDGREEAPALDSGGLKEFMDLSEKEGGLFLQGQAAVALDVHPSRIGQMVEARILRAWTFFGKTYVSCAEVSKRRASEVKTGRPKRSVMQRIVATGKILAQNDARQIFAAAHGK